MKWLWPDIDDIESARKIARNGAGVCFFITIVTAVVTYLQTNGHIKLFEGLGPEAYLDAVLFLIIGIGICFISRIACIAGLCLYIFEQLHLMSAGSRGFSLMAIYFTLVFVNSVRASFEYHRFKKVEQDNPEPTGPVSILTGQPVNAEAPAAGPEAVTRKSLPLKKIALIVGGLAVLGGALWFALPYLKPKHEPTVSAPGNTETVQTGAKTFKMHSGEVIRGEVTMEDPDFFIVRHGGKEDVLARTDIASIE